MRIVIIALLLLWPVLSMAETPTGTDALLQEALADSSPSTPTARPTNTPYDDTLWIFFVGTGLIALAGYGVTRWRNRFTSVLDNDMQVIHSLHLGPKHKLVLVELDKTRILLGVSDAGVTLLKTFESEPNAPAQTTKADLWLEALRQSSPSAPVNPIAAPQDHSGLFARVDTKPGVKANRESDSVLIGLKSLEARIRTSA